MTLQKWRRVTAVAIAGLVVAISGCGGGSTPVADAVLPPITDPGTEPETNPGAETPSGVVVFTAAGAPAKLSAWQLLLSDGQTLSLQQTVLLNLQLKKFATKKSHLISI